MRIDERDHRAVMSAAILLLLVIVGCGHNIRRDFVGRGVAGIQPRDAPAVTIVARAVPVSVGTYAADIAFELPRAQAVDWKVSCPGHSVTGTLGDDEVPRAAERPAAVAVRTPIGPAVRVALPAPEIRFHHVSTSVDLEIGYAGACELTAATDDPDVIGSLEVTRVRDLDAEAHAPEIAAAEVVKTSAIASRHQVIEHLVADGAWLDGRERRLAVIAGECHGVRSKVRQQLVAFGAVERTPKPDPLDEVQPAKPAPSATWSAGAWTWTGARWTWVKGRWRDARTAEPHHRKRVLVRRPVVIVPPPPPPVIVIPMH